MIFKKISFHNFSVSQKLVIPEVQELIIKMTKDSPKCQREKFDIKKKFEDLGFDSLDVVELIVAFEENLGFDILNKNAKKNIQSVEKAIHFF